MYSSRGGRIVGGFSGRSGSWSRDRMVSASSSCASACRYHGIIGCAGVDRSLSGDPFFTSVGTFESGFSDGEFSDRNRDVKEKHRRFVV